MNAEQKLARFFDGKDEARYSKGEILLAQGEEPTSVFYLKKGYVRMSTISRGGDLLMLNIFKSGSYFPLTWAISDMQNGYDYEAMTEVVVCKASRSEVLEFIKGDAEVLYELAERLVIGLGGLAKRMETLFFGDARVRVASSILLSAERFGEENEEGGIVIKLPLSHQDVSGLAGLTRETTSLEMKKLDKEKIICYRRKYVVALDMERLRRAAGES